MRRDHASSTEATVIKKNISDQHIDFVSTLTFYKEIIRDKIRST